MPSQFTDAMDAEIGALEQALLHHPDYVKLVELRRIRALYGDAPKPRLKLNVATTSAGPAIGYANSGHRPEVQPRPRRRTGSPERQAILDAAKAHLTGRQHPTPTIDIFEAIKDQVKIPGRVPRNNLSAMMSNSDEFVSHGRSGWTLAGMNEASDDLLGQQTSEASNSSAASPTAEPNVRPVDPVPGGGT